MCPLNLNHITGRVWLAQIACKKKNIQVVYMHVMQATNDIEKYFLKKGVSITN